MRYKLDYKSKKMEKFLSLKTTANNIGEEIQILAAQRFLPHIDGYINKERLNTYRFDELHKVIINGWFMRNWENFHFSDSSIQPLIISLHITPDISSKFFTAKNIEFLKKYSPIGCRDYWTLRLMNENNIPSYYSGCLTLTLQKNKCIEKKDYILLIDCPDNVVRHVKTITDRHVITLHPMLNYFNTFEERLLIARLYLKKIQQANLVITSRLHGALPALALETPTIFINRDTWNTTQERCSTYSYLMPFETPDSFIYKYNSLENIGLTEKYLNLRMNLIKQCSDFTQYCSDISPIPNTTDDEDVELLFSMLHKNEQYNKQKVLYDIPTKYLWKNLYTRLILKKNDDDIY